VTDNWGRLEGGGQRLRFMYDFGARVAMQLRENVRMLFGEDSGCYSRTAQRIRQALESARFASGDIRVSSELVDMSHNNLRCRRVERG
jgi:hypothetical protein